MIFGMSSRTNVGVERDEVRMQVAVSNFTDRGETNDRAKLTVTTGRRDYGRDGCLHVWGM